MGAASKNNPKTLGLYFFTLPTLQKTFVIFFFELAWKFCIERWRGFLVNFFRSPFPTKRSGKTPQKIREKFGAKFGAKFGTKIRKIRETPSTQFIHIIFPQNISRYRVGELYLINSPQNFSRHAPVTKKTYTLIRYVYTALWQIRPVKVHLRAPTPIPAR